jgi:hypothetical protein
MPTRRIQRGPSTGGAPAGFQNSPAFNELYVDGLTDAVVVGTGISGVTAAQLARVSIPTVPVTFANLPVVPTEGMVYVITDSSVNTWGTVIAGGGANRVLAYYNGANWTVAAK